jgi:antitoxin HicB
MNRFAFPASLEQDENNRIVVSFLDLPGVHTDGADMDEAILEGLDCLTSAIFFLIKDGADIPKPSEPKSNHRIFHLSAYMSAKAALYLAWKEAAITKTELAKRLGVTENEARRLLDPKHQSKIQRIDAALAILGKTLVVDVLSAA